MSNEIVEYIHPDTLSCRLRTTEMLEAEPYCYRVGWLHWDSPFREAGLRIEDCILGVDGVRYDKTKAKEFRHKAIGQYAEYQHWTSVGAKEGQIVTLEVKRDREILQIKAALVPERSWSNSASKRYLSPTGPEGLGRDIFDSAWTSWYEKAITDPGWKLLDGVWTRTRQNTRSLLKSHQENFERVKYLLEHYPGKFAQTVMDDYRAIEECLKGRLYQLKESELEWRTLGDARAKQISEAAKTALKDFLAQNEKGEIDAFPAIDATKMDERAKVAGKIVTLDRLTRRNWLMVAGKPWLVASGQNGYYFINLESPEIVRFWEAEFRYKKLVKPSVSDTWTVTGRILPDPKMFVSGSSTITGLQIQPMAIAAGEDLFVDLTQTENNLSYFAAEKELANLDLPLPPANASPAEVMQAFFHCLKLGEEDEWKQFFAEWDASKWDDRVYYYALRKPNPSVLASEWLRARKVILSIVYDVRVHWVGEVKTLLEAGAFEGAPKIEQVAVEIDHIGLFDGEYRAFQDVNVHRMWSLQRLDGGPWRISANCRDGI